MQIELQALTGSDIALHIDALAKLRIAVFREYPYLYDGDAAYEAGYLENYARHDSNLCVVALCGDEIVGASTAMWMKHAEPPFQAPFEDSGIEVHNIFYFGESVLLPEYRGRGIGRCFFDLRETRARSLGASVTAFCAVDRPDDHPARPENYRPLHGFWRSLGYTHHPQWVARIKWRESGQAEETEKTLSYWIKRRE